MTASPPDPPPPILYRYYGPERIDALESGTIRFSRPQQFNDTFDSEFRTRGSDPKIRYRFRTGLGICCFTEDPDNHLMWVNYAKHHTGFVIGFNMTDPFWSQNGAMPSRVKYISSPPKLPSGDELSVELSRLKSEAWSYEKEWRAVRMFDAKESRDVQVDLTAISQVIIGFKMEHHHTAQLLDVVETYSGISHIAVFDSRPDREQWKFKHMPSPKRVCSTCSGHGYTG